MELIGYMDSPYVRRVAITAQFLRIPYDHRELSVFRDYDELRKINPQVKVPTVLCDNGHVLMDSTLIIDYMISRSGSDALMPSDEERYCKALNLIGTALVAMEKAVQLVYELKHRPEELRYQAWIDRVAEQMNSALENLETAVGTGANWLFGNEPMQADINAAIAWRFTQLHFPDLAVAADYPGLVEFSARAEALPEFKACPID